MKPRLYKAFNGRDTKQAWFVFTLRILYTKYGAKARSSKPPWGCSKLSSFPEELATPRRIWHVPCHVDFLAWGRNRVLPVVVLLSQRKAWTKVPRIFARVSSTDVTSFRSSLKLSFFFSIDEVHRLRLINWDRGILLSAIASRLKVELSVQRNVHNFFENQKMDTENLCPSDPITESFHKNGHMDRLCKRI